MELRTPKMAAELKLSRQQQSGNQGYPGRDKDADSEVSSTTGPAVEKRKFQQTTDRVDVAEAPDDASKKPKISFGFNKPSSTGNENVASKPKVPVAGPISMKLGAQKPKEPVSLSALPKASATVARIFAADDEDDEEEMPPEAKMRMRNLGRETPTSAGPNSFGKTKRGFCDTRKVFDDLVIRPKKK